MYISKVRSSMSPFRGIHSPSWSSTSTKYIKINQMKYNKSDRTGNNNSVSTHETEINALITAIKKWCFVWINQSCELCAEYYREALFLWIMYKCCKGKRLKQLQKRRCKGKNKIQWRVLRAVNWKVQGWSYFFAACIILYLRLSIHSLKLFNTKYLYLLLNK